jgi:toxin ParE1/3/4
VSSRYSVRPKAIEDLDDQAFYLATKASNEIAHRFLIAAHETFSLLATQPEMGWRPRLQHFRLRTLRVFRVSGFGNVLVIYLPLVGGVEVLRVVHGSRDLRALLLREGFL